MSRVQMDEDALFAGLDLVGRTGAQGLQFGWLHDDVPTEEAGWYAHAQYRGARIMVEDQRGPVEAVEALARRLLEGGRCTNCGGLVTLSDRGAVAFVDSHGPDGSRLWTKEEAEKAPQCRWTRMGRRWTAGCDTGDPPRRPGPNRADRRAARRRR
jgi:hypothetical protein